MKYVSLFFLVACGTPAAPSPGVPGVSGETKTGTASLSWTKGTITGTDADAVGAILSIAYGNGRFVAYADAKASALDKNKFALTSTDGKAWTVTAHFGTTSITGLHYNGTKFVGAGNAPDGEGGSKTVYAETGDGITWTFADAPGPGSDAGTLAGTTSVFLGDAGKGSARPASGAATAIDVGAPTILYAACTVGSRVLAAGQMGPTTPPFFFSDTPATGPWSRATFTAYGNFLVRGMVCTETRQLAVWGCKSCCTRSPGLDRQRVHRALPRAPAKNAHRDGSRRPLRHHQRCQTLRHRRPERYRC